LPVVSSTTPKAVTRLCLAIHAILLGTWRCDVATEADGRVREVTLSTNRQVGLASEFARAMRLSPKGKLLETLVRIPGAGYGVLLLRRPRSYSAMLRGALAGIAPADSTAAVRALRDEWDDR